MDSNKSRVNFAFALIVVLLGLAGVRTIYVNLNSSAQLRTTANRPPLAADVKPAADRYSDGSQLPADHPPTEAAQMLMALQQKIDQDPQNVELLTQIANLYYDLGQYDKAADFYQQSLNIRPGAADIETDLATCFHYLGQEDKSLEILEKVLQYQPGFPQAMFNKGAVLVYGKNDVQGALRIWEELLRSDPAFSQQVDLEQQINKLKTSVP